MVGGPLERWGVGAGVSTLVATVVWRVVFQEWAIGGSPFRYDMFEPFLHPWEGLTWITYGVLWPAFLLRRRFWIPLVAVATGALAIQIWMGIGSAWIGVADGHISPLGALVGVLSVAQLGLTAGWILLIVLSKRMRT